MRTERQRVGIRAALASVVAALRVLASEILGMLARPRRELCRVPDPASSLPKEFQPQGPPQIWVDYVASHNAVWFSDDNLTDLAYQQDSAAKKDKSDPGVQPPVNSRGVDRPRRRFVIVSNVGAQVGREPDEPNPVRGQSRRARLVKIDERPGSERVEPPLARNQTSGRPRLVPPRAIPTLNTASPSADNAEPRARPAKARAARRHPALQPTIETHSVGAVQSRFLGGNLLLRAASARRLASPLTKNAAVVDQTDPSVIQPPTVGPPPAAPPTERMATAPVFPATPLRTISFDTAGKNPGSGLWPALIEPDADDAGVDGIPVEFAGTVPRLWRQLELGQADPTITQQRRR
jgi:hypothetical protein